MSSEQSQSTASVGSDKNYEDVVIFDNEPLMYMHEHFVHGGACVSVTCNCGLTHFTTAHGHGDYNEGELELYRSQPDTHIEWTEFDTIHFVHFNGCWVVGCRCGQVEKIGKFLLSRIDELTSFVKAYWANAKKAAGEVIRTADEVAQQLNDCPSSD